MENVEVSTPGQAACPACGAPDAMEFLRWAGVPVNSCLLLDDEDEARSFPRGDLRLEWCSRCGFAYNAEFDPEANEYSARYEETQGYSPRFREFADELARRWVKRHGLEGRHVVEIGCGKGEFLAAMVRAGAGSGVGVDPGVHPERIDEDVTDRLDWVRGFFPDDLLDLSGADAVVCRHTLEHIGPVADFLADLRRAIGDRRDTAVLFELPDTLRVLREGAFWDTYYEHCSYFTAGSLVRLFRRCGFDVLDVSYAYDGQYLVLEARPADIPAPEPDRRLPLEDDLAAVEEAVSHFRSTHQQMTRRWRSVVRKVSTDGGTVALWGGGSKAVAFLAALGDDAAAVGAVVDINPHKTGKYIAGAGHRVIEPVELKQMDPTLVVVMNPVYVDEIGAQLASMGLHPTIEAL